MNRRPVRRNILITGASSGLGAEMARQFAALGRNVALCARRTSRLEQLRDELHAAFPLSTVAIRTLDVDDHHAVFDTFREFDKELGGIHRVIVNAGLGDGYPVGTGRFAVNRATAFTNFVSGLAQCEAAMEIFRERGAGHLVLIASVSAFRGRRRHSTAYAASKAAIATLAEGICADVLHMPIQVSTIFPGFIHSEMTATAGHTPFIVDTSVGVAAIVRAIERERRTATVPMWPWLPVGWLLRHVPLRVIARLP
ncbi:MAG TPA: short chain dehydrogenase [Micromonosporaceae bacterium]|nr:short chain dehydrogenase [Micromonosporaceae bacterium]HCU49572.1 short chain dehydrogenase [Micromonosporaceae bacterium]